MDSSLSYGLLTSPKKKALDDLSLPKGKFLLNLLGWHEPLAFLPSIPQTIYLHIQIMSKFRSDFIAPNPPSFPDCLFSLPLPRISH